MRVAVDGLPDRIRQARQARGWTQQDLARAVGVSRSAVAQWETGRAGQVTSNLTKISRALGAELSVLVGERAAGAPPPLVEEAPPPRGEIARLGDEIALLRMYRLCSPSDQRLTLATLRRLSQNSDLGTGAA